MSHSDRPEPENIILENGSPAASVEQVLTAISELGFTQQTFVHEPLYTVKQASQVDFSAPGAHTKNLFLRNKKGLMFLVVVEPECKVDLRSLRDMLQLPGGQIAFASTERLGKYLGVVPGAVSPLAVINDHDARVNVYFQHTLLEHEWIYLHPCRNTHSTRLRTTDLLELLKHWNHPVTTLNFDSRPGST